MTIDNGPAIHPAPRRYDARGMPTGQLIWHRDEDDAPEVTRFDPAHVVALSANLFHHTVTGMLYATAGASQPPVAEVFDEQLGGYRRLRLPPARQAKTFVEWNEREEARRRDAALADQARRQHLRATRRPITLAFVEATELPTVKAAFDHLADCEALIEVRDGRLHIELSPAAAADVPGLPGHGTRQLRNAVRVVLAAETLVIDHLERGADLPDLPVDPHGSPIS